LHTKSFIAPANSSKFAGNRGHGQFTPRCIIALKLVSAAATGLAGRKATSLPDVLHELDRRAHRHVGSRHRLVASEHLIGSLDDRFQRSSESAQTIAFGRLSGNDAKSDFI
jgi:hypothetical protein